MRKDVKFGLTIGGILVVTLVVYVVVLTRGGDKNANPQEVKQVTPVDGGATPAQIPPVAAGGHTEGAGPRDPAPADGSLGSASDPTVTPGTAPATEPSVAGKKRDWDDLMVNGMDSLSAAPVTGPTITETPPTISGGRPVVSIDGNHPMIDVPMMSVMPPTTVRPEVADIPAITADPAPPAPTTRSLASGPRQHVVRRGETLSTIAKAAYGNVKYWDKILGANPGINPNNLKVGTTLTIPDISNLPAISASSDHGADLPPAGEGTVAAAAPLDPATSYRVVSGDTLDKIAIKLYGDVQMSDKLYENNKTLMGEDRDRLKLNWVLKLPSPPATGAAPLRVD